MKKIAMYSTSALFGKRVTGGLKRFLELYNGFIEKGIDVDLFCTDSSEVLEEKGISAYTLVNTKISDKIFIPTELKFFLKNISVINKIKNSKYKSVIVFDVPTAIGLCLLGVKNLQLFIRQDLIGYKRISISEKTKSKLIVNSYLALMKLCETICFIRSERIILQCEYDYIALIKRHKFIKNIIKRKSIIQINNVNPSWIINQSSENNIKGFMRKKELNRFIIGFIGDFNNERKGQRIFVDAIKNLIKEGFDIEAILIGDGIKLSTYKEECKCYPQIKFTGRLENPISVLKGCDLMVVPSLADSCPNTIMEALYNDIPVIGARSGGIPEILLNENFLFEPNALSLQNKIKQYLNKNNLLKLKKLQQIRKKELEFDWSFVIAKHLHII